MSLLTSAPISRLAIALLRRQLVLVGTVTRVPGDEYAGPSGGTVTIRVPQPRTAKEQATPGDPISFEDIDEVAVDVTLAHLYDATRITDEDLSLSLENFGRQVLLPQVAAVAEAAENELADVMNGLDPVEDFGWSLDPEDPEATEDTVLAARELLTTNGAPAAGRYMAVAPDVATRLLRVEKFTRVDARGSANALEEATIGRLYGITFVESAALTPGSAVAYHSSAFGFGNRPPAHPGGGVDSSTASEGGVSLRHLVSFDPNRLSTVSVVSVFAGASVVSEDEQGEEIKRAIKIETAGS